MASTFFENNSLASLPLKILTIIATVIGLICLILDICAIIGTYSFNPSQECIHNDNTAIGDGCSRERQYWEAKIAIPKYIANVLHIFGFLSIFFVLLCLWTMLKNVHGRWANLVVLVCFLFHILALPFYIWIISYDYWSPAFGFILYCINLVLIIIWGIVVYIRGLAVEKEGDRQETHDEKWEETKQKNLESYDNYETAVSESTPAKKGDPDDLYAIPADTTKNGEASPPNNPVTESQLEEQP